MTQSREHTRRSAGFTMVEMLAALIVLMLVGAAVVVGINTAVRVQQQSTFVSESAVLAGTINSAAADCIHYKGTSPFDSSQSAITLHNKRIYGAYLDVNADGRIVVIGNVLLPDGSSQSVTEPLINDGSYDYLRVRDVGNSNLDDGSVEYTIYSTNSEYTYKVDVSYAPLKS